jgi:Spy/CpxP family protein refolding chaperone
MKRITIWASVAVVLVVMAVVILRAEARERHGWCGRSWHHAGAASYLAHELKLSDAQRAQLRTIWQAERPMVSADLHQFLAENKEMNAIAAQGNPDAGKVQEIANREGAAIAALLVEKERMQSKVYASVLNPEQRAKADDLLNKLQSRLERGADRLGAQTVK